jgi:hypothetical protein
MKENLDQELSLRLGSCPRTLKWRFAAEKERAKVNHPSQPGEFSDAIFHLELIVQNRIVTSQQAGGQRAGADSSQELANN